MQAAYWVFEFGKSEIIAPLNRAWCLTQQALYCKGTHKITLIC